MVMRIIRAVSYELTALYYILGDMEHVKWSSKQSCGFAITERMGFESAPPA